MSISNSPADSAESVQRDSTRNALRVLVIGAGGHARVSIEALLDQPGRDVVGCLSKHGEAVENLGVDVVGADDDLERLIIDLDVTHVFVAVGNNRVRAQFVERCRRADIALATAVSRGAYVSHAAEIAGGVLIAPGAVISAAARLATGVIVNSNASVDHDCVIGACSHIAPGVAMGGTVIIGEHVLVGVGARIIPGISIGDGATIGAGTVVVRDVAPGALVVGTPARSVERRPPWAVERASQRSP
jgi:UDP-perosamine 4-acetyltransferase